MSALTTKPYRPYRERYAGIRRQIARANGLHPIRDRAAIEALMPRVMAQAKQILTFRKRPANHIYKLLVPHCTMAG